MKPIQSNLDLSSNSLNSHPESRLASASPFQSGISSNDVSSSPSDKEPPDPYVSDKPVRRKFSASYKLRILQEADLCTQPGKRGALLRRQGLYSSTLTNWRRQRQKGMLEGLSTQKPGRKTVEQNPLLEQVTRLERENQLLRDRLHKAETIIEVQKKVSLLLTGPPALHQDEK